MDKHIRCIQWELMPGSDQQYLKFSYERYRNMQNPKLLPLQPLDSFTKWLEKRGISKN